MIDISVSHCLGFVAKETVCSGLSIHTMSIKPDVAVPTAYARGFPTYMVLTIATGSARELSLTGERWLVGHGTA